MARLPWSDHLARTIELAERGSDWKRDRRGLMPLARARATVKRWGARGNDFNVNPSATGTVYFPAEYWAALMSLADADELVRAVAHRDWKVAPHGVVEVAPALRYGEAILPWLASFVDARGAVARAPVDLAWNLNTIGTPAALALLLRLAGDRAGRVESVIDSHGRLGYQRLAELAHGGDAAAREALRAYVAGSPKRRRAELAAAIGKRAADALVASDVATLTEATILATLDAAAAASSAHRLDWPGFQEAASHFTYHAMRIIAARARDGDGWGVMFEVVQGDARRGKWPATIQRYTYGSRVRAGGEYLEDARPLRVPARAVDDALARRLDLRPGLSTSDPPDDWVLAIRAALARDPGAFWTPAARAVAALGLGARPEVVVATDRFAHVAGRGRGKPSGLPSKSATYRSLARAVVARDGALFEPGKPNTDWRLWATRRDRRRA